MKKIQKGFTLIELMIVVAIIGILAAVAIPAYQDYIIKAKLSKVRSTMDSVNTAIGQYYNEYSGFPADTQTVTNATADAMYTPGSFPTNVWTSIGLKGTPSLPGEVSTLLYDATAAAGGQAATFTLTMTFAKIKTATVGNIDGTTLVVTPILGSTAIQWNYVCAAGTDAVVKKYFKNPDGSPCAAL